MNCRNCHSNDTVCQNGGNDLACVTCGYIVPITLKRFRVTLNYRIFLSIGVLVYDGIMAQDVEDARKEALDKCKESHGHREPWVDKVEEL